MQRTSPVPQPEIRLRIDELDRLLEPLGYKSDGAKARFLGIGVATFSRIRNGTQRPGNKVIAKIRAALPKVPYEQLFVEEVAS